MAPIVNDRMLDIVSHSAAQTQRLGARLGELLRAGDVLCLEGDLGSGKTCFVQGIGRGLGLEEAIHSPTFILANEHRTGRVPLYHLDVYRVRSADEAIGFGLEDYLGGDGVVAIEWAEKIGAALPADRLWVRFRHMGESKRGLLFEPSGVRYEELLNEFRDRAFGAYDVTRH